MSGGSVLPGRLVSPARSRIFTSSLASAIGTRPCTARRISFNAFLCSDSRPSPENGPPYVVPRDAICDSEQQSRDHRAIAPFPPHPEAASPEACIGAADGTKSVGPVHALRAPHGPDENSEQTHEHED